MTTNPTVEEINVELNKAQNKDINIKIPSAINRYVYFLNVTIANENIQLRTSIFHKPTTEPYILPFTSDGPHHVRRNIPYTASVLATRICSHQSQNASTCTCPFLLNKYKVPVHVLEQVYLYLYLYLYQSQDEYKYSY